MNSAAQLRNAKPNISDIVGSSHRRPKKNQPKVRWVIAAVSNGLGPAIAAPDPPGAFLAPNSRPSTSSLVFFLYFRFQPFFDVINFATRGVRGTMRFMCSRTELRERRILCKYGNRPRVIMESSLRQKNRLTPFWDRGRTWQLKRLVEVHLLYVCCTPD